MELSNRLQAVAGLVTAGYRLADIGTDHAYIPIFLAEQKRIPWAVAMDINRGPLGRAEENIRMHGLEEVISVRQSDGVQELLSEEAESMVIAGMGGGLMIRILKDGMRTVCTLRECILQPQSEIEKVRAFLLEEGFSFIQEEMVKEEGKYYPMMKVTPPSREDAGRSAGEILKKQPVLWNETELKYGKLLLEGKHPVLLEFLQRELGIKKNILRRFCGQDSPRILCRKKELEQEIRYIREAMEYYAVQ